MLPVLSTGRWLGGECETTLALLVVLPDRGVANYSVFVEYDGVSRFAWRPVT